MPQEPSVGRKAQHSLAIRQLERSAWQMRCYASELGRSVDHVTVIMDMTTVMNSLRNIKAHPRPTQTPHRIMPIHALPCAPSTLWS